MMSSTEFLGEYDLIISINLCFLLAGFNLIMILMLLFGIKHFNKSMVGHRIGHTVCSLHG